MFGRLADLQAVRSILKARPNPLAAPERPNLTLSTLDRHPHLPRHPRKERQSRNEVFALEPLSTGLDHATSADPLEQIEAEPFGSEVPYLRPLGPFANPDRGALF